MSRNERGRSRSGAGWNGDEGTNSSDANGNVNGFKEYKRGQSRKWRLALFAVLLATIGTFLPPIISLWILDASKALIILSGTEWVSVVTMVVGLYIGGNVYQKHIERRHLSAGIRFNASMGTADYAEAEPGLEPRPAPGLELDEADDEGREA